MGILSQLSGNEANNKWTVDQEVAFISGIFRGDTPKQLEEATGRPKTGFYAKKKQLLKRLSEAGITDESTLEEVVAVIRGNTYNEGAA